MSCQDGSCSLKAETKASLELPSTEVLLVLGLGIAIALGIAIFAER